MRIREVCCWQFRNVWKFWMRVVWALIRTTDSFRVYVRESCKRKMRVLRKQDLQFQSVWVPKGNDKDLEEYRGRYSIDWLTGRVRSGKDRPKIFGLQIISWSYFSRKFLFGSWVSIARRVFTSGFSFRIQNWQKFFQKHLNSVYHLGSSSSVISNETHLVAIWPKIYPIW